MPVGMRRSGGKLSTISVVSGQRLSAVRTGVARVIREVKSRSRRLLRNGFIMRHRRRSSRLLRKGFRRPTRERARGQAKVPSSIVRGVRSSFKTSFSSMHIRPRSSGTPRINTLTCARKASVRFTPKRFEPSASYKRRLLNRRLTRIIRRTRKHMRPAARVKKVTMGSSTKLRRRTSILKTGTTRWGINPVGRLVS